MFSAPRTLRRTVLTVAVLTLLLYCAYRPMRAKARVDERFASVVSPSSSDPVLERLHGELSVLDPRLQHIELYASDQTYTLNKHKVHLCLRDEHGRYYQRNMLVYVLLHEYAHVLCPEEGHTPTFQAIFHGLLRRAAKQGLYNPRIPPLKKYCGIVE